MEASVFSIPVTIAVVIIVTLILLIVSWRIWIRRYSCWYQQDAYPWIGNALSVPRDPHLMFLQLHNWAKEKDAFLGWVGTKPLLIFSKVEYVEAILSSRTLLKKGPMYRFLKEWLGSGLLISDGEKWKNRRRLITPTFHFAILNDFASIFEEQAVILVNKLNSVADSGKSIDIQIPVSLAKLDAICETSMGVKINAQNSSTSEYVKAVSSLTVLIQMRQRSPWLWPEFIYRLTSSGKLYYKNMDILHNFTADVIKKSIARRKEEVSNNFNDAKVERNRRKVFLDMLLDLFDVGEIDVDGIREEVDTFLFEGHDTTASALSWTLYELGRRPDIQDRLYEEILCADSNLSIVEKVKSIKYFDYVVKEGLRLHPPVPIFTRVMEEDIVIDNKLIPNGTEIGIFAYALHRNPMYWDEPDTFNPDRFADEKFSKRNPYCYIPFSAGSRNCVGQKFALLEEKIMLYYLLLNYHFRSVQEEKDIKSCMDIIHKSENGLFLQLKSR